MEIGALVHTAVSVWQLFALGVVNLQAPDVIDIAAQFEPVEALQASGLAPELPLASELKLASKMVVWAYDSVVIEQHSAPIKATKENPLIGLL